MVTLDNAPARDRRGVPELVNLINCCGLAQAISVVAELGIPDLLADGPKHVEDLARESGSHPPSLKRLLRALSSVGVCSECEDGSFALDELGELVRSEGSNSLRSWVLWFGRHQWPMWGNLLHSVQTGESARRAAFGTDGFGHLERDAEAATIFNDAMVELTRLVADEVVRTYDFTGVRSIVDVGGGRGALLAAILEAYPSLRGTVLDRPHAFAGVARVGNGSWQDRCDLVAGDCPAGRRSVSAQEHPPRLGRRAQCPHPAQLSERNARAWQARADGAGDAGSLRSLRASPHRRMGGPVHADWPWRAGTDRGGIPHFV